MYHVFYVILLDKSRLTQTTTAVIGRFTQV